MSENPDRQARITRGCGVGMVWGVLLGTTLGIASGQLAIGMTLGLLGGVTLGGAFGYHRSRTDRPARHET